MIIPQRTLPLGKAGQEVDQEIRQAQEALTLYRILGDVLNADQRALAVLDLTDPDLLPRVRAAREHFLQEAQHA